MKKKFFVVLAAIMVTTFLSINTSSANMGRGMMGAGYGMGPGMMQHTHGMGSGTMSPGYGHGPGMMQHGQGMGSGMMQHGRGMGPGMMQHGRGMGPGMMGPGYGDGPRHQHQQTQQELEEKDAKQIVENYLKSTRNPNLKLGKITDMESTFEAEILTKNDSLVDKLVIDKNTGWMRSVY